MEELHGKEKVPKETKQHGELNNHKTAGKKGSANANLPYDFKYNSDGTSEYTIPPSPVIYADDVGSQTWRKSDGTYVDVDTEAGLYGLVQNTGLVYGQHGIRNYIINTSEDILKGSSVKGNDKVMALIFAGRIALSTTKKYLGTDGHGENSFLSSVGYGLLSNLKPSSPQYFKTSIGKLGNSKLTKIAEASDEAHHMLDKVTFTKFSIKGSNSTLGKWKINPLSTQFGGGQFEAEYLSGKKIWYAFNSHGASNGGHGSPHGAPAGEHAQQKIENEGHASAVANSHNASSIQEHANAEPEHPTISIPDSKDEAASTLIEYGRAGHNRRTLYIAAGLINYESQIKQGHPYEGRFIKDQELSGEMGVSMDLGTIEITPDIQYAMALFKKSGVSYAEASHTRFQDLGQNIIDYTSDYVTPIYDYFRLAAASFGFTGDDARNKQTAYERMHNNPFNDELIKEAGGKITINADGSKTVKIDPRKAYIKIKSDATYVKKPNINVKTLAEVQKEKAKAQLEFGQQMQTINAYNRERITGIKAGTVNNPLPGQPFVTNTSQNVFGRTNINPSGKSGPTISQNRNPFSK